MTATQSTASVMNSPFLKNLFFKVRENRLYFLLTSVLQILGAVIGTSALFLTMTAEVKYNAEEPGVRLSALEMFWMQNGYGIAFIGALMFAFGLCFLLPIAFGCFDYLTKKQRVDMILSLPVTSNQRFWSDYLAGLGMSLLPTVVSFLLAALISAIGLSSLTDEWAEMLGRVLPLFVPILLGCVSLYSFVVLAACCCGNPTEMTLSMIGLVALPPAFFGMLWVMIESQTNNYCEMLEFMYFLKFSGPVGSAIMLSEYIEEFEADNGILTSLALWAVQYLFGTALLVLGTWRLYINRKAEDVSKPFVYRFLYHALLIFCVIGGYCTLFAFDIQEEMLIPYALFGAIPYLLIEIAINRGMKKLYIGAVRYIVTSMLSVVLIVGCLETGCFGLVRYTPDASSVRSVDCAIPSFYDEGTHHLFDITNEELIETVTEVYSEASKRSSNAEDVAWWMDPAEGLVRHDEVNVFMSVTYNTKIGMTMERGCRYLTLDEIDRLKEVQLRPAVFREIVEIDQGLAYVPDDEKYSVTLRWESNTRTFKLSGSRYKEMWETYIKESEQLTLGYVNTHRPSAQLDFMPLYDGIHNETLEYLGFAATDTFGTTTGIFDNEHSVVMLLSADSPWLDETVLLDSENGLGRILADDGVSDATIFEGVTVGYTLDMLRDIRYYSTPMADSEWVFYIRGKYYPVSSEDADHVAALAEEHGTQMTAGLYLKARESHILYNRNRPDIFPDKGAESFYIYAERGYFDTYLTLYPDQKEMVAMHVNDALMNDGVPEEERAAFLREHLDYTPWW